MTTEEFTAHDAQLAFTSLETVADGPGAGTRVLVVQPAGGIHSRVLLDRGMDVGASWWRGSPVSWMSASGERRGGTDDRGAWNSVWSGGLITTCGLRNVGPATEGFGHHGHLTDAAAQLTSVNCDDDSITVTGIVREPNLFGRGLVLRRSLTWAVGGGTLTLSDTVTNEGWEPEQAPILYHLNLGYPFISPDTATAAGRTIGPVFESDVDDFPPLMRGTSTGPAEVFEHAIEPGDAVRVVSPSTGSELTLTFTHDTLPRFYTCRWRRPGAYLQVLEPANCGQHGRVVDREQGRAPMLDPGQSRTTGMRLQFS